MSLIYGRSLIKGDKKMQIRLERQGEYYLTFKDTYDNNEWEVKPSIIDFQTIDWDAAPIIERAVGMISELKKEGWAE